jgi:6,7-dimethyl-8-ribityllumazine synthase
VKEAAAGARGARVLIIDGRYYEAISDLLAAGAIAELETAGASYERVTVPGALEVPLALAQAVAAGSIPGSASSARFDGAIALGCVIRGETTHYETVCNSTNHWLLDLAVRIAIRLANATHTVDPAAQAFARAAGGRKGKGGDAARACLSLIGHARAFAASAPGSAHALHR